MQTQKRLNFRSQWLLNTILQASPQQLEKPVKYPESLSANTVSRAAYWLQSASPNDAKNALSQVRKTFRSSILFIVLLSLFAGILATRSALSTDLKTVNLPLFLVGTLGAHFLALCIWIGLSLSGGANGNVIARGLLNVGTRIGRWLYGREQPMYECAFENLITLATRKQLLKPFLGLLSHLFWLCYLLSTLLTAGILLVFAEYHFIWETTVLSPVQLERVHALLNASLAWFNVSLPTLTSLSPTSGSGQASMNAAVGLWLLVFIACYGVFVRWVGTIGCLVWLKWRSRHAHWETSSASYQQFNRYQGAVSATVIDKDEALARPVKSRSAVTGHGAVVVWLEERVEAEITGNYRDLGVVSVGSDLDTLVANESGPWNELLIVIHLKNSPDRANLKVLSHGLECAEHVKVFFVEAEPPNFRESWLKCITEQTALEAIEVREHA